VDFSGCLINLKTLIAFFVYNCQFKSKHKIGTSVHVYIKFFFIIVGIFVTQHIKLFDHFYFSSIFITLMFATFRSLNFKNIIDFGF